MQLSAGRALALAGELPEPEGSKAPTVLALQLLIHKLTHRVLIQARSTLAATHSADRMGRHEIVRRSLALIKPGCFAENGQVPGAMPHRYSAQTRKGLLLLTTAY
jgi:hypothetical protein